MSSTEQRFSSRWGLIVSVLGIAVGTGNIWRFPRIVAQNSGDEGAGAFLFAWFIFLLVWSVPLIIAEYALGRKGRMGVIGTIAKVAGKKFAWMGAFIGFVATAIMFYYSVVAGWCIYYFTRMISNPLPVSMEASQSIWDGFQASGGPVLFHAIAMGIGAVVVIKGINSIERVNKILIPALFVIVLISVIRALTLNGAFEGIDFLFTPDWATLKSPRVWLEALTQNAWDTGAGWGLILTYGAYMHARHGVVKNALITGFGNNMVSLLAAMMIFGIVFATLGAELSRPEILEVMQTSGPAATGLTFIWMPQLFANMQFGGILSALFFLGLSFAAFSSLIAMIELASRLLVDLGLSRNTAVISVAGLGFALGIPSAVNLSIFENQDFVWGVALMISGAFVAFSVVRYGTTAFRLEAVDNVEGDWKAGPGWEKLIKYIVPAEAVILLVWWLWQAADVENWYDPVQKYTIMTCVVQWTIAMGSFYGLNKWLNRKMFTLA